jgi:hypothetical protein
MVTTIRTTNGSTRTQFTVHSSEFAVRSSANVAATLDYQNAVTFLLTK